MNSAADILADYLAKHQMSQHQLERLTGITQASISRILKKKSFHVCQNGQETRK